MWTDKTNDYFEKIEKKGIAMAPESPLVGKIEQLSTSPRGMGDVADGKLIVRPATSKGIAAETEKTMKEKDGDVPQVVNHPPWYTRGSIEVADFIADQDLDFFLGNALKYICRAGHKGNVITDLEKSLWYLNYKINLLKKQNEKP